MKTHILKFFSYTLFIFSLAAVFYMVFLLTCIFFSEWSMESRIMYFIVCSIIVILFLKPIKTSFELYINKIIFPVQKKVEKEIDELCEKMIKSLKCNEIFDRFLEELPKIINNNDIFVYYYQHNTIYEPKSVKKSSDEILKLIQNKEDQFLKILETQESVKIFNISDNPKIESLLRDKLLSHNLRKIVTFGYKNERLGWFALGDIKRERINTQIFDDLLLKVTDKLAQTLEHAILYQNAKRESVEKGILIEIGKKISNYKSLSGILNLIIDSLAEIVHYDAAGIFLIDVEKQSNLKYKVLRGYSKKSFEGISLKVGKGLVGWSAKHGRGLIVQDVSKDSRYIDIRTETHSQMVIPIKNGEKVIGAFCLESDKLNFFTGDHFEVVKTFASQAAVVIENARLYFEFQEKKEIKEELKIAGTVQMALFPKELPKIKSLDISAYSKYYMELGGDFYHLEEIESDKLAVAIGDASGKGVTGAILMSTLYTTFRLERKKYLEVYEIVENLNNFITGLTQPDKYATFFYGTLNIQTGIFKYTNAGHNPPYLIRNSGEYEELRIGGTVLGFFKDIEYKKNDTKIDNGDILVLYTDGITECRNKMDEEFGEKRFLKTLVDNRSLTSEELKEKVINELKKFADGKDFSDDISLVIIKKV